MTPASAMNEPISMWSGPTVCVAAAELAGPGDRQHVRADASDVGAHLPEHAREVLDVRLARRVADDRRPRRQRGRHHRVLRRHDGRLVHEDLARAQPAVGRGQDDVALLREPGAQGTEGVEVGIEPPAADDVASRRGHLGVAEAGEQRPGEQERRPDAGRMLAIDRRLGVDVGRAEADLVVIAPVDRDPEAAQDAQHRLDVADARDVAHDDLLGRQDRGGENRQRAVLVTGGNNRAAERHAAVDDELLHTRRRARGIRRLG